MRWESEIDYSDLSMLDHSGNAPRSWSPVHLLLPPYLKISSDFTSASVYVMSLLLTGPTLVIQSFSI